MTDTEKETLSNSKHSNFYQIGENHMEFKKFKEVSPELRQLAKFRHGHFQEYDDAMNLISSTCTHWQTENPTWSYTFRCAICNDKITVSERENAQQIILEQDLNTARQKLATCASIKQRLKRYTTNILR